MERLNDDLITVEEVIAMLQHKQLKLTRMPLETVKIQLTTEHQHKLDLYNRLSFIGKKNLPMLPYAFMWLQQHKQHADHLDRTELWSKSQTHRVHIGKPSLGWMLEIFCARPKVVRQCLIPAILKRDTNELLIFERGENWKKYWDKKL